MAYRRRRAGKCNEAGCPEVTRGQWCPEHQPARTDAGATYRSSSTWQRIRRQVLDEHRDEHGNWCPGDDDHAAHPSSDLTVDHVDPLATTGGRDTGRYRVVCRSANSRRQANG